MKAKKPAKAVKKPLKPLVLPDMPFGELLGRIARVKPPNKKY